MPSSRGEPPIGRAYPGVKIPPSKFASYADRLGLRLLELCNATITEDNCSPRTMSQQADATHHVASEYLLRHVYRRRPTAEEISENVLLKVLTVAEAVADKSDDILNKPRYYSEDGRRRVGYVGASISKRSVQGAVNRADTSAPGLGALARLVMDKFEGTAFVKLFMYNAYEGLFPFHSDVLPTSGKRKIRVSTSLSNMMPPFCLRRKKQGEQFEVYSVCRQFLTITAMDFESSGRLNRD